MKRFLYLLLCVLLVIACLPGCAPKQSGEGQSAKLPSEWLVRSDSEDIGEAQKWYKGFSTDAADGDRSSAIVWYNNVFKLDLTAGSGERLVMTLSDVNADVSAWLNGKFVGELAGAIGLTTFDVTQFAKKGGSNTLSLRVDYGTPGAGEYSAFPAATDTYVSVRPAVIIAGMDVRTDVETGSVALTLHMDNDSAAPADVSFAASVSALDTDSVMATAVARATVPAGASEQIIELKVDDFIVWDTENPFLYAVNVSAAQKGAKSIDTCRANTGFSSLTADDEGYFRLNGERVFVKSADVSVRYLSTSAGIHKAVDYLRTTGFNTLRVIGGTAPAEFSDYCDKVGMMTYQYAQSAQTAVGLAARDGGHASFAMLGVAQDAADEALTAVRGLDSDVMLLQGEGNGPDDSSEIFAALAGADKYGAVFGGDKAAFMAACVAESGEFGLPYPDAVVSWYEESGVSESYPSVNAAYSAVTAEYVDANAAMIQQIRSNEKVSGYGFAGDVGIYPPTMLEEFNDALNDLRWLISADKETVTSGGSFGLSVGLSNFDVLKAGSYTVHVTVTGVPGIVYEKYAEISLTDEGDGVGRVIDVLEDTVTLDVPAGEYIITAEFVSGAHPVCAEKTLTVVGG